MRFLFLFGFLFIINSNASNKTKNQSSYPEIKKALETYCLKCEQPSLEIFQINVEELERFVILADKGIFYTQAVDLLLMSYMKLAFEFEHNDEEFIRSIIDKIYIYELYKLKQLQQVLNIYGYSKDLLHKFDKINSDRPLTEAVSVYFENMVEHLKIEEDSILKPILKGQKLTDYIRKNHKTMGLFTKQRIPETTQALFKRIKYLRLTKQDKLLINAYKAILSDYNKLKLKRGSEDKDILIEVLIEYIKSNQISLEELNELRTSALILRSIKSTNDFIWWSQARNNSDLEGQLVFLNNQMLSTRQIDALKMLVELGQVEMIVKWSKKLTFDNSDMIFDLALRQAEIRKGILNNSIDLASRFKQEMEQSIDEIINLNSFESPYYLEHITWLSIEIGLHRFDSEIQKTFLNLLDFCCLSKLKPLKKLTKERRIEVIKLLEEKMSISDNIQYSLNTFEPIRKD
jgi:hypothetical protein